MDGINIEEAVKEMTIEEKACLVHGTALFHNGGVERLNVPPLIMSDGPLGVRFDFKDDAWERENEEACPCSWLVSDAALASSWNTDLAYRVGNILGMEASGRGKDVILAPGINICRTPLCGRNFEYMGEDPYLAGMIAAKEIAGIQSNDVAACVKHFALNNQETDRMEVNVTASERALREIYLPAFFAALSYGGAYAVMCSYNKFRGKYASENEYLLKDILRDEWKYDGTVISDWGAVHGTDAAFNAGVDIEMGVSYDFDNYYFAAPLIHAVKSGRLSEDVLDGKVRRVLALLRKIKKLGGSERKRGAYNLPESHKVLLDAARESVVLLKNENKTLPFDLSKIRSIAVIGDNAARKLAPGGGSSEIDALFEITPLLGISMLAGGACDVRYSKGYSTDGSEDADALLSDAVSLAEKCDAVIFAGGLNRSHDTEGADRASYDLPYGQDRLISELLKANKNTAIYINAGSAVNLSRFAKDAPAICYSPMIGMMGGLALAEILFGKICPSGKLAVSFPAGISDCPARNMDGNYAEGIYVGYRHYETRGVKPLFCFGHGLSYAKFEYSGISARYIGNAARTANDGDADAAQNKGADIGENQDLYEITCTVKNTGSRAGKEIIELYVTPLNNTPERPALELKGFAKTELMPGCSRTVSFILKTSSFAYYSVYDGLYRADAGVYRIKIGSSCEDIRLETDVSLSKDYFTRRPL